MINDNLIRIQVYQLKKYYKYYLEVDFNDINAFESLDGIYTQLCDKIKELNLKIVYEKVFGSVLCKEEFTRLRMHKIKEYKIQEAPLTFIEGKSIKNGLLSSIIIYGITTAHNSDITLSYYEDEKSRRIIGAKVACPDWKALYLNNISIEGPDYNQDKYYSNFSSCFEEINIHLRNNGFEANDIVRTWIYLKDIKNNYATFNTARNNFFQNALIDTTENSNFLPASTGIEGISSENSVITVDLICYDKNQKSPQIKRIYNELQNEAEGNNYLYKPSFSRGILLMFDDHIEIQISGTASINKDGESIYINDSYNQIKKSFINVKNILEKYDCTYNDVCQSTYFFKNKADYSFLNRIMAELQINKVSSALTVADICRDDLLFELDGIAIRLIN